MSRPKVSDKQPRIEEVYRFVITYDFTDTVDGNYAEGNLEHMAKAAGMTVVFTPGSPASYPYATVEGEDRSSVKTMAARMISTLKSYKSLDLLEL